MNTKEKTKTHAAGRFSYWTEKQILVLKKFYLKKSNDLIARKIGRSVDSIHNKAKSLGLTRNYKKISEKFWSDENLSKLKELYPNNTNQLVAEALNLPLWRVSAKAKKLGLLKDESYICKKTGRCGGARRRPNTSIHRTGCVKFWSEEKIKQLKSIYADITNDEIARIFYCPKSWVVQIARQFGLKKSRNLFRMNGKKGASARAAKGIFRPRLHSVEYYKELGERFGLINNELPIIIGSGFFRIRIKKPNGFIQLHKYIWSLHHGEIPPGFRVFFKDNNSFNCSIENLELLTITECRRRQMINNHPEELRQTVKALLELKSVIKSQIPVGERYKKPKTRSIWSDDDINFLKTNYRRMSNEIIARQLNRPVDSITSIAFRLDLTAKRGEYKRLDWSEWQIEEFKRIYLIKRNKEVAKIFKCSLVTVWTKAQELGIAKGRHFKITRRTEAAQAIEI